MAMYKIKYECEDYYDGGESRWITIYNSKTPIPTDRVISICKEYIIKQIKEDWNNEDYLPTLKMEVEHQEKNSYGILEIWIHATTEGHDLLDYDYDASFAYIEPVEEEEKEGWC